MGRFNRVVAVDVPHHGTQRGNGRRFVLGDDVGRTIYLKLLRENISLSGVALIRYCFMSNHVHLIAVPYKADGLAQALKQTHGRYASYWNAAHQSNGHVWQGRYYSGPSDRSHLWEALRYTELNPVRAGLVAEVARWPWSSAAYHRGAQEQGWIRAGWRRTHGASLVWLIDSAIVSRCGTPDSLTNRRDNKFGKVRLWGPGTCKRATKLALWPRDRFSGKGSAFKGEAADKVTSPGRARFDKNGDPLP